MFHPATKIVIVTETFVSREICRILDQHGIRGYTLVPAGGKGLHHLHPTAESVTVAEEFTNLKIEAVCRERSTAEEIAREVVEHCFQNLPGVIYLEPVEVIRAERF